jgi:hypothetical protein
MTTTSLRVTIGLLCVQIAMLSVGLGQPWTNAPSSVCAVSTQYPMLLALFVHLVALVCSAVDGKQPLLFIVLAIVGLGIPLPIGLYFYLYDCNWTNAVWCAETLLNGVWILYWYRRTPSAPTAAGDSPSVSETEDV